MKKLFLYRVDRFCSFLMMLFLQSEEFFLQICRIERKRIVRFYRESYRDIPNMPIAIIFWYGIRAQRGNTLSIFLSSIRKLRIIMNVMIAFSRNASRV